MPGTATAQQITYLAERGLGVADRVRPDFDPIGYRLEGFTLYPAIDVTTFYTDNFRATAQNRLSDVYAILRPSVRAASNWNRNAVEINAYYEQPLHAKLTQENVPQYGGSALGRYDISRETSVQLVAHATQGVESRTSINSFIGTVNPVKYDAEDVLLSASHAAGDFQVNIAGGASRSAYQNVRGPDGVVIDQRYRDVHSVFGNASMSYRISPGVSAVVSGQVDRNLYSVGPGSPTYNPLTSVDRNSTGYTLQAGVNFELTSLLFGTIQAGLLRRNYRDPRLKDFSGPSLTAQILWNVTPLTSIRFNAARTVEDTASINFAGNVRTRLALTADHELFRYVILTADTVYSHIRPNGPLAPSDEFAIGLAGKYLISRKVTLLASIRHMQRTSDLLLYRYRQNTISASARYNF